MLPSLVQPECEQAIKSCKELWQVISAGAASTEKFLSAATGSAGVGAAMGASGQKAHTKMAGLQAINKVLEEVCTAGPHLVSVARACVRHRLELPAPTGPRCDHEYRSGLGCSHVHAAWGVRILLCIFRLGSIV